MIKQKYLKKNKIKINKIIIIILTLLFLCLAIPMLIAINPYVYFDETKQTSAEDKLENPNQLYDNVYNFLVLQQELSDEFTENETSHMIDVRIIFNTLKLLTFIILIITVTYFMHIKIKYKQTKKHKQKKQKILNATPKQIKYKEKNLQKIKELEELIKNIKKGAIISLILITILVLFTSLNFHQSFTIFHEIFFPQGNWAFPANSLIITLFPQDFFISITTKILISTITIIVTLIGALFLIEKYYLKNKK